MRLSETGSLTSLDISEVAITDGLVGWWPLNGTTQDLSGNRLHGTPFNSPQIVPGIDGKLAYQFNGTDSYIRVYKQGLFSTDTTIAWWEWDLSTVNKIPWSAGLWTNHGVYIHRNISIAYSLPGPIGETMIISGQMATANRWDHYTLRYVKNTRSLRFYKNGTMTVQRTTTAEIVPSAADIFFGTYNANSSWMTDCILSDIRIFDRALSDEEIRILYELTGGSTTTKMKQTPNKLYLKGQLIEV